MNREVGIGELAVDQFPALENDGFSKRSGLTVVAGDFAITTYKDGAIDATPVTIEEIGVTGNYKVSFTPPLKGTYVVEVLIIFNKDIWAGYFHTSVREQVDKIDKAMTVGPAACEDGSLLDRLANKDSNKTFNQATDSLEGLRNRIDAS